MSGKSGTESDITELEDLQAQLYECEGNLETCQDDLAEMTQQRDTLAATLEAALDDLDVICDDINTTNARAALRENS